MKKTLVSAAILIASILGTNAQDAQQKKIDAILKDAKLAFVANQDSKTHIPGKLLAEAEAVMIGSAGKGALIFGGGSGQAIAMKNNIDNWSPPAFYDFSEGSFGIQFTAMESRLIALFMTKKAARMLYKDKFNWDIGLVVEAGPHGGQLSTNSWQDADILVYRTVDGLDVGIALSGGGLSFDQEANEAEYSQETKNSQHQPRKMDAEMILGSTVPMPKAAKSLANLLREYSFVNPNKMAASVANSKALTPKLAKAKLEPKPKLESKSKQDSKVGSSATKG